MESKRCKIFCGSSQPVFSRPGYILASYFLLNSYRYHGNPSCPPQSYPPQVHKGLIAGLIKGNHWVFISPDHKALAISGGGNRVRGFGGG